MCFRFFHIVERMSRNQRRRVCFVQFAMWQNRERNLPTPTASYLTWTTNFTHTHTHTHTYEKFNSILQLVEYWCWQTNRDKQITACTVVQAVVKANSQSNGKRQISTPPLPWAPKHLNGFRWNLEHITMSWVWPHLQVHVVLRQCGWSGLTRDLSLVGFL